MIYAIGDIHGDLSKLRAAQDRVARDAGGRPHDVVHVGDLVDRGPDSRGVIAHLMAGQAAGRPWRVLKGNHDRMMTEFIRHGRRDPRLRPDWDWLAPPLGAAETLVSYGADIAGLAAAAAREAALAAVPGAHLDWLESLPAFHAAERFFFCHAGVAPGVALADQVEDDLIWVRAPFDVDPVLHPKVVVHGHVPVGAVTHYGGRINIDTGCAYGGPLSVIVCDDETGQTWEVTAKGRRVLAPPI
ncbi:MAG: metallophosphoesterase [Pseudomonadota bacterium]